MPHVLESKLASVRSRARRLVLGYGICRTVACIVATVTVLALCDWWLHFEDRGVRTLALLAAVGVSAWASVHFLWTAWKVRFPDVQLAQSIQRRFPLLRDRLSSSMEFLREPENDPRAGSARLRQEVIAQTTYEVELLDLKDSIEPRPARRAALWAMCLCGVALLLVVLDPASAGIALARLVNPVGQTVWPQANHLAFKQPVRRIALGQTFEVEVIDSAGARLPDEVRMHLRFEGDGDKASETVEPMRLVGRSMLTRMENVTRPFSYRAEGGDDHSMEWITLEVAEPPAVSRLDVRLKFPDYTNWPEEVADKFHVRAIVGTQVTLTGQSTKPLREVKLCLENGGTFAGLVRADGLGFEIPGPGQPEFVVQKSGAYWLELVDREGLAGGRDIRYDLRAIDDNAPTLTIEQPESNIHVTASARVPLRIATKDDLAIQRISLHFTRSDRSDDPEVVQVLFDGPPQAPRAPRDAAAGDAKRDADLVREGDSRLVEHAWELASLELKPGAEITLWATASDYRPEIGQSQPRKITVISPEDLQDRMAQRQTLILGELARVLKLQQESRAQVGDLQVQLDKVGSLNKQDLDHLQSSELTQRQVDRGLTSPSEGVTSQVRNLIADLENNKVDNPEVLRHMQSILDEIARLEKDHLPAIGQELTRSYKRATDAMPDADQPKKMDPEEQAALSSSLVKAREHQDQVVASLEQLLGELGQWDSYRRFHREIGQLRKDQAELREATGAVGQETLTRDVNELDAQQRANLEKLGARQLELARRFEKLQQQMEQMQDELQEVDPLASDTLADAVHQSRQESLGEKMRQAGQQVQQNQVGQATKGQQGAEEALEEMMDILANRREQELARLVRKFQEAERQLEQLRDRQEGLRKKMAEAAQNPDEQARRRELERLSREQRELQQDAERFARTLKRLEANQAGRKAATAAARMGQAGQQGEQGDGARAEEDAAQAKRDLDDAQQELAQQRRQAESDLAEEQLARLEDGLQSMLDREQQILVETRNYDEIRQANGNLSRAQALSVRDLGRQERALENETTELATKLAPAPTFSLALKGAARDLSRAASLLDRRETGVETQQAELFAIRRIEQLLKALAPDAEEDGGPKDDQQQQAEEGEQPGDEGSQQQQPGNGIRSIAELKLLKLMQEDLNQRTIELDEALRDAAHPDPDKLQELNALAEEQGRLADLLLDMIQESEPNPEDDPESLPDLSSDAPQDQPERKPDAAGDDQPGAKDGLPEATIPNEDTPPEGDSERQDQP